MGAFLRTSGGLTTCRSSTERIRTTQVSEVGKRGLKSDHCTPLSQLGFWKTETPHPSSLQITCQPFTEHIWGFKFSTTSYVECWLRGATLPSFEELPKRKRVLTLFPVVFSCNTVTALDSSWSWTMATEVDTFLRPFAATSIGTGQAEVLACQQKLTLLLVWQLRKFEDRTGKEQEFSTCCLT